MRKTSRLVYVGLLVAQALVLHIVERIIPVPFITPGAKLNVPPAALYMKDERLPPNIVDKVNLNNITKKASFLLSKVYKAITVTKFASPSFAPGVIKGTGIILSKTRWV